VEQSLHLMDPSQLARIADLELLARLVVEGFLSGLHRSPHAGASVEFAQYRPYAQGDDLRFIDWKLFARTDRLHLKQFHEETNLRATILVDCSGSMDYGSAGLSKFDYARMLAACLAMMLNEQKDAAGLIAYHHELIVHLPPRNARRHLRRLLAELQALQPGGRTDTPGTLRFLGDVLQPRGMIILISDLLHPAEAMINHLKSLRAMRHDVIVFQVADPAERDFPFERTATFIDAEEAEELYAVPDLVREGYLANRERHFGAIRRECLLAEIDAEEFLTSEPLDRALHRFIHRRNRSLMTSSLKRTQVVGGGRG